MLTFAVEIPVSTDRTIGQLLGVARQWIEGSPHRVLPLAKVESVFAGDSESVAHGQEKLRVIRTDTPGSELAGVQFDHVEKQALQWSTDLVGKKSADKFSVAVRVSCEALAPTAHLPRPRKPYIIRQLFAVLGGGNDGSVRVSESPIYLKQGQIEYAAALLSGRETEFLPIVYLSVLPSGGYLLNPGRLAGWLSGMAHVVVEPNRAFSFRLMQEVDRQNVYGGTIGVYWPDGAGPRKYFYSRAGQVPQELGAAISDEIRRALVNRRPSRGTTWSVVEEARSKKVIEQLRQQGSTELNEYIAEFDKEVSAQAQQLETAEREIWRLRAEVRRLENQSSSSGGLIKEGSEQDLFAGERAGIVLDALSAYRPNVPKGSRREHVLDDLLSSNVVSSEREEIERVLKGALEGYQTMDAARRAQLDRLGFVVTEDGKHYKAVFLGDGRYTYSIAKTSSDHRAGLNLFSDIRKTLL